MNYIKTIRGIGFYLIILGVIMFLILAGGPDPEAVGVGIMSFVLIIAPGVWLVVIASKTRRDLIRKCPYCDGDIHKDAIFCRHCRKEMKN